MFISVLCEYCAVHDQSDWYWRNSGSALTLLHPVSFLSFLTSFTLSLSWHLPTVSPIPPNPIPVCHHWDHCNLGVRRIPQVPEETQATLHPGLLCRLLHPGISHDHRGTPYTQKHTFTSIQTYKAHVSRQRSYIYPLIYSYLMACLRLETGSRDALAFSPTRPPTLLWISRQICACKVKAWPSEDRLAEWNKRGWSAIKIPLDSSEGKIQP